MNWCLAHMFEIIILPIMLLEDDVNEWIIITETLTISLYQITRSKVNEYISLWKNVHFGTLKQLECPCMQEKNVTFSEFLISIIRLLPWAAQRWKLEKKKLSWFWRISHDRSLSSSWSCRDEKGECVCLLCALSGRFASSFATYCLCSIVNALVFKKKTSFFEDISNPSLWISKREDVRLCAVR